MVCSVLLFTTQHVRRDSSSLLITYTRIVLFSTSHTSRLSARVGFSVTKLLIVGTWGIYFDFLGGSIFTSKSAILSSFYTVSLFSFASIST